MAQTINGNKRLPQIDMTPMVDLAFLLIAFFMLATSLAKPKAMQIIKPANADDVDVPVVNKQRVMSILLGKNDSIYHYQISEEDFASNNINFETTNFSSEGIRAVIKKQQQNLIEALHTKNADSLIILIKGSPHCKYKNLVDILDEMRICKVKQFALIDRDKIDTIILRRVGGL